MDAAPCVYYPDITWQVVASFPILHVLWYNPLYGGADCASPAVTAFKDFPGRTHWLIASSGWEEVADEAIAWVERQLTSRASADLSGGEGGRAQRL